MKKIPDHAVAAGGFSLVEVIIVVAIIGVLSGIGLTVVGKVTDASRRTIAANLTETLNNATKEFDHAQYSIVSSGENGDALDELHILQTLQWRDPGITIGVAGPFMRTDWNPATSDNTEDYRIVWAGTFWKLVEPGNSGVGLKVNFEVSDVGVEFTPGADWEPVNATASNLGSP